MSVRITPLRGAKYSYEKFFIGWNQKKDLCFRPLGGTQDAGYGLLYSDPAQKLVWHTTTRGTIDTDSQLLFNGWDRILTGTEFRSLSLGGASGKYTG